VVVELDVGRYSFLPLAQRPSFAGLISFPCASNWETHSVVAELFVGAFFVDTFLFGTNHGSSEPDDGDAFEFSRHRPEIRILKLVPHRSFVSRGTSLLSVRLFLTYNSFGLLFLYVFFFLNWRSSPFH